MERTHHSVHYVSSYVQIPYPGGDVPSDTGVCTDEVIRSYRALGIDLQRDVHEDMLRDFGAYPHGRQGQPDTNIDHRRVPNLMVFFARRGIQLPINAELTRLLARRRGAITHIGIVVNQRGHSGSYMVVHNIGRGPQMEDVLFSWKIIGHYRYYGPQT